MNQLAAERSLYLLQHANNPVNWYPWGKEALDKAIAEQKLLIISIGYAACHWCHVMEHECFEDLEVAEVMNKHFVCIKIDREERPDLDQIYMNALQLMKGQGGWPLNIIALPNQKPIYGGTYFKKSDWISVLENINSYYHQNPSETTAYADKLTEGIRQIDQIIPNQQVPDFTITSLQQALDKIIPYYDFTYGAHQGAPKFPMPCYYLFLLKFAHVTNDNRVTAFVQLTLNQMANGGIYDHLAGGFARYAVDEQWKIPHFEKMLYDNAQLISLYTAAFLKFKTPLYKQVAIETIDFCVKDFLQAGEGFQSAFDADSEGVEGKYYCFSKEEITNILGNDAALFCNYFEISEHGNWEENINILHRKIPNEHIAESFNLSVEALSKKINLLKTQLLNYRKQRVKPALDDKQLTSWNALMIKALADAYLAFDDMEYLKTAVSTGDFIYTKLFDQQTLYRSYQNKNAKIPGFLDDYALTIDAFIALYEITFDEKWLKAAEQITSICLSQFQDQETQMFYYTAANDAPLIARKFETIDNVIPSSNAVLAQAMLKLGELLSNESYIAIARVNLQSMYHQTIKSVSSYANWASLLLNFIHQPSTFVVTGPQAAELRNEMSKNFHPFIIYAGAENKATLPIFANRFKANENWIYICKNNNCALPVQTIAAALPLI
jgi:uncharacterized protein YyaL (SSP411 family)